MNGAGQTLLRERSKMMPRTLLPFEAAQMRRLASSGAVAFLAGVEARAEQHAGRAQHQHRRQPAAVTDAAGGGDRHPASREVDDRRHDVERGARGAVAARFRSLRDQDVGAGIQRLPRHVFGLHLADQERT